MRVRIGLAIASVALLAVAGCTSSSTSGSPSAAPPSGSSPSGPATTTSPTSTRSGSSSAGTKTAPAQSTTPINPTTSSAPHTTHQKLTDFRISSVTFIGSQEWALGSADCLSGAGTCDAIEYSGDGGATWRSAPAPKANIARPGKSCSAPCVAQIRFATSKVGYAFGAADSPADAFFMTTDGGNHWTREPGHVVDLESLNGNVIRVTSSHSGCPGPCDVGVQTAVVGSTSWTTERLPGGTGFVGGLTFARAGGQAYLLVTANPAGGGSREFSTLWTSSNNGASWKNRGEPCPQTGHEVDSTALTAAPDGSAAVLCQIRGGSQGPAPFAATSTNGGKSFHSAGRGSLGGAEVTAFGAASASVLLVSSDETYRSSNGGTSFSRLSANAGSSPGQLSWIAFGSSSVGHGISVDGRQLWITHDGGVSWQRHQFG